MTLYGIPSCDSVKKARAWLADHDIAYTFHDYKKSGVPEERLLAWVAAKGWQTVLNRRGSTWRAFPADLQVSVVDAQTAVAAMLANASLIKRPVIEAQGSCVIGWTAEAQAVILAVDQA